MPQEEWKTYSSQEDNLDGEILDQPSFVPGTDYIYSVDAAVEPTISPNDPLNWPTWRKAVHLFIILALRGVTTATSNVAFAGASPMMAQLNVTLGVFDTTAGCVFFAMGVWVFITAPIPFLYGSRINYIVGTLLGIISTAWFANARGAADIIVSEIFVGASASVGEAVALLSFSQVFYQHQIPRLVATYVLVTLAGSYLGPLIAGYNVQNDSWHWVGYAGLIAEGIMLVLVFFCLEETYFDRAHFEKIPGNQSKTLVGEDLFVASQKDSAPKDSAPKDSAPKDSEKATGILPYRSVVSHFELVDEPKQTVPDPPRSYWQTMALITPAVNLRGWGIRQYFHRMWLQFRVFMFPPVLFAGIQWGGQMAWITFYMTLETDYWMAPPWNYTPAGVGVMMIPTFLGSVVGYLYTLVATEWFVQFMAKRNGDIKEAEMRLWCILPAVFISPLGFFLLGAGTQYGWAWPVPYVALGFIGFGFGCAGDLSLAYCADCYPEMTLETVVGVAFMYDIICGIFSIVCNYWMTIGPLNSMISIGVLDFVFTATMFPMIIWGKKCREWTRSMYMDFVRRRDSLNSSD